MKIRILVAWAVGCAAGFGSAVVVMSSGCGIGKARASSVTMVPCTGFIVGSVSSSFLVTYNLPDADPETLANLSAIVVVGNPKPGGQTAAPATISNFVGATVHASGCHAPEDSIAFVQR